MDWLNELENKSIYIIREAQKEFGKVALLWSAGKDSTVLLHLCQKAFFGELPFPVVHIDTGSHFKEMYTFRDSCVKKFKLDLIIAKNEEALKNGVLCGKADNFTCCNELKTNALKQCLAKEKFDALLVGIRRDEHGIRSKERVFSPRDKDFKWDYWNQPAELWDHYQTTHKKDEHIRVHPLLNLNEEDIWKYIKQENLEIPSLYFSHNGKRYRSLGCEPTTTPFESSADTIDKIIIELEESDENERSGRSQEKEDEYMMQKLRSLGYM